ncbi:MAG: IPT/TIG domain-containing protein [Acidimicrobiales bacterium]|nr:IPT/TIG domain-containing protein [Acidimicrobiales bacterium]
MSKIRNRHLRLPAALAMTVTVGAMVLAAGVGTGLVAPTAAGAGTISETMAGNSGNGYVSAPFGVTPAISFSPSTVPPGGTVTMNVASTTVQIPSAASWPVVSPGTLQYFFATQFMFPVPAGSTIIKSSLPNNLQWTTSDGHNGPFDLNICNGPATHCAADGQSSTFFGNTPVPYVQGDTGVGSAAHINQGVTLTIPGWSAQLTVTGAAGTALEATMSEVASGVHYSDGSESRVSWYPSVPFTSPSATPPAYQYQPLASASISGGGCGAVPSVTAVLPNSGPVGGGTTVTIQGTNLSAPTQVYFGSTAASSFSALTSQSIQAVVPASASGPGTVDVQVFGTCGQSSLSSADQFTYTAGPVVSGVSPRTGPGGGGTQVTITGAQLNGPGPVTVRFGNNAASNVVVQSASSIVATSPPGSGLVDVTVQDGAGTSLSTPLDHFNYVQGYWFVASDGGIFSFGPPFLGSMGGTPLNKPVVGMASSPDAAGYWLVASDGGIFSFGDASFFGSTGAIHLNQPVVGMASTPDGFGYWLVASDGGIFAFGDARFFGSMGGTHLNQPIVGIAPTPDGGGYWLVAADGGIFAFGDAGFYGSTGAIHLNKPVVGMTPTTDGRGYWFVASDGGIFNYGDAGFFGSMGGTHLNKPVVGMAAGTVSAGYWLVASDGGIFSFGTPFFGSTGSLALNKPVVGMTSAGG